MPSADLPTLAWVTRAAWYCFGIYWFAAAFGRKKTKRSEGWFWRLSYSLPLIGAVLLLTWPRAHRGWLGERFVPFGPSAIWAGTAMTVAGIGVAIWARRHLGANWSGMVTLKEGHELIRSGPYRRIRHPIYTGILLALLGTAIEIGRVSALIALAIAWLSFAVKARREESFLKQEFGSEFAAHRQRTGMFLPRWRD